MFGSPVCSGPFNHIIAEYKHFLPSRRKIEESNEWNSSKHVIVTEQVDLKDQTTSGLQLLDEQRRYQITGKHNNLMHNNLLRLQNRDGFYLDNVNDGIFSHVRSEFADGHDRVAPSTKRACCHIMPPNVQVTEMQELNTPDLALNEQRFITTVYAHFNSKAAFSFSTSFVYNALDMYCFVPSTSMTLAISSPLASFLRSLISVSRKVLASSSVRDCASLASGFSQSLTKPFISILVGISMTVLDA